jgi:hypothetical protein
VASCAADACVQVVQGGLGGICSLTVGVWRSLRIIVFGTYQGASTSMRKSFDWKRSRISMLEVEAVPQSCVWFESRLEH